MCIPRRPRLAKSVNIHPRFRDGFVSGSEANRLVLVTVNGFQIQGVSEYKRQFLLHAQVSEPVPVKGRFTSDNESLFLERLDSLPPHLGRFVLEVPMQHFPALLIDNANVHCLAVQIDPAVEWVLIVVEIHHGLLGSRVLEPQTT